MTTTTLEVDRDAREVFNLAAIAIGTHDVDAAFDVCRKLGGIEPHYRLALRVGSDAPGECRASNEAPRSDAGKPGPLRRMDAKFPGRCPKCAGGISVCTPIAYDATTKRAFHEGCAP